MKDLEKRIAKLYKKRAKAHADLLEVDSELDKLIRALLVLKK